MKAPTLDEHGIIVYWSLIQQLAYSLWRMKAMKKSEFNKIKRLARKSVFEREWEYDMDRRIEEDMLIVKIIQKNIDAYLKDAEFEKNAINVGMDADRVQNARLGLMQVKRVLEYKLKQARKKANAKD